MSKGEPPALDHTRGLYTIERKVDMGQAAYSRNCGLWPYTDGRNKRQNRDESVRLLHRRSRIGGATVAYMPSRNPTTRP